MKVKRPNNYHAIAKAYIDSRRSTLWADFDISSPDRRLQAIEWLAGVLEACGELAEPVAPPVPAGVQPLPFTEPWVMPSPRPVVPWTPRPLATLA